MATKIEWTRGDDGSPGKTWNPTVGCSRVSPGCDHCYAIGVAHRAMQPAHQGLTVRTELGSDWTGEVRCLTDRLTIPLRRRKPTRWFVDSMSDLFHPQVPEDYIARVWAIMHITWWHTFQVLTKRPQRMASQLSQPAPWPEPSVFREAMANEFWRHDPDGFAAPWPLPNVWLGTSIESDRYTWRADHLRSTPAAIRFLSLEPLLGPLSSLDLTGIDWVIIGGESGPGARPMDLDWAEAVIDQCHAGGVAVFVKQLGTVAGGRDHHDITTFPRHLQVRTYPTVSWPPLRNAPAS